jgi:hypothetical protein
MLRGALRELELLSPNLRDHIIKALIAFLRITNGNSSEILKWYDEAKPILRDNERTFLKYLLCSGLRKEEGIKSFNRIIE